MNWVKRQSEGYGWARDWTRKKEMEKKGSLMRSQCHTTVSTVHHHRQASAIFLMCHNYFAIIWLAFSQHQRGPKTGSAVSTAIISWMRRKEMEFQVLPSRHSFHSSTVGNQFHFLSDCHPSRKPINIKKSSLRLPFLPFSWSCSRKMSDKMSHNLFSGYSNFLVFWWNIYLWKLSIEKSTRNNIYAHSLQKIIHTLWTWKIFELLACWTAVKHLISCVRCSIFQISIAPIYRMTWQLYSWNGKHDDHCKLRALTGGYWLKLWRHMSELA